MEKKQCMQCKTDFNISDEELKLYEKFKVPVEDICFKCSQMQRLSFRNERILYQRKCDFSGDPIISIYSPDKPYKVYQSKHWYGDKWDPMEYGRDFDFGRPFFEQYKELQLQVPRLALLNVHGENSDYCNMTVYNRNCYLVFGGDFNEDVLFGTLCMNNKDSLDIDYSNKNELCYFMSDSLNCYGCSFTFDSRNCSDCTFISDCIGCNECILCTNLVKKSYFILNKQYSKEEYFEKKKELLSGSYQNMQKLLKDFLELHDNRIVKYYHGVSCENCSGDYIKNSKNCHNCYDVSDSEDLRDVIFASKSKDCFNSSLLGDNTELCYSVLSTVRAFDTKFSYFTLDSSNIEYSEFSINSENLFGCDALRHKKYCILNKQYKKEEFEEMRKKIIEHMKKTGEFGKFFPRDLSCFGYNETTSFKYYPLTKQEALSQGFKWHDEDKRDFKPQTFEIPDKIKDVSEDIVDETLVCLDCGKNYKIVAQEFAFYKKRDIPVPRSCPECRHKMRTNLRNPKKLWDRKCVKCDAPFKTTYAPQRPETVYCEECYLKEIT